MSIRKNSPVFNPGRIGALEIKNRLVRSATFENAATIDGKVSDRLMEIHRALARGGAGLIITGISWFYPDMQPRPQMIRADDDSFVPGLQLLAGAVHETAPDCRIMLQLYHPGRQVTNPEDMERMRVFFPPSLTRKSGQTTAGEPHEPHITEPVAPSAIRDTLYDRIPRELTSEEIEKIINSCVEAIRRAQEAGFDGVQLHAAHGWLFSSFLSPRTNQRKDKYGGSTENRARIVTEICRRAREKTGDRFPLLIKFNVTDFLPGGIEIDEGVLVARLLTRAGFDAVEVSGGMWEALTQNRDELGWPPVLLPESRTGIRTSDQEAYFMPAARAIKKKTTSRVISVGGYRSFDKVEEALSSGAADFVALSRPLIRQPDLFGLWYTGTGHDKALCISCNACLPLGGTPLACRAEGEKE